MKDGLIDPVELKARLFKVIKKNPVSIDKLSKQIGVAAITLEKFLKGKVTPNIVTLIKIENFVEKHEK